MIRRLTVSILAVFGVSSLLSCASNMYDFPRSNNPYSPYSSQAYREANEATHPTDEEIRQLKYGEKPKGHEALFKKTVLAVLKDPDSAKFRNIKKPKKMWGKSLSLTNFWVICGEVNSKNSYGGYVGFEPYAVQVFSDGSTDILALDSGATKFTFASERMPCS